MDVDRFIVSLREKRQKMLREITDTVVPYETYRDTVMRAAELLEVIDLASRAFKGGEDDGENRHG